MSGTLKKLDPVEHLHALCALRGITTPSPNAPRDELAALNDAVDKVAAIHEITSARLLELVVLRSKHL